LEVELQPALACQSFPQTLSAVRAGAFTAILPTLALGELPAGSYVVVKGEELNPLTRALALVWTPRLLQVRPTAAALGTRTPLMVRAVGPLPDGLVRPLPASLPPVAIA
jgi:DNA-binding transcriptional LysR family regulator